MVRLVQMPYQPLPTPSKQKGQPRKVGFELEFSGIGIDETSQALQQTLEGTLDQVSEVEWILHSAMGEFKVELD